MVVKFRGFTSDLDKINLIHAFLDEMNKSGTKKGVFLSREILIVNVNRYSG